MQKTAMQPQSLLCDSRIEHKRSKWGEEGGGALENHQLLSTSLFNPAKNLVHPVETLPSSTHTLFQQQRAVGSFKATPELCRSLGASLRDTIRYFPHACYCGATCGESPRLGRELTVRAHATAPFSLRM